jgi:hypothetical protein
MILANTVRPVRDLYGRYAGKPVWIAGSDPSLSGYPDDFLADTIGITLHLAHRKFPRATWRYSSEYDRSTYLKSIDPSYRELPIIVGWPVYGYSPRDTAALFSDFREVYAHGLRSYPPSGIRGKISPAFTDWKIARTAGGAASVWGAHGTCLHTAIYMAVLLGASEIHVIGAGHGQYSSEFEHFQEVESEHHDMRPGCRLFSDPIEHVPYIEQTLALKNACEKIGIPFYWHRRWTPAMEDLISIDTAWLEGEKERAHRKFGAARTLYRYLIKRPINEVLSRL